jgi:two-component system, NarL family, nitrate/nitrite response regulator NarL
VADSRNKRTTVIVADDHPLYREAVVRAVRSRPDFELVAEADDGRAALDAIRSAIPDVAVLDVEMPGLRGVEIVDVVKRDALATKVVLLSAHLEGDTVFQAVQGGVAAYLSKASSNARICETIAAVARGEIVLPPEVAGGLAAAIQRAQTPSGPNLTPRERDVLHGIAAGRSAPQIARDLHLSTATVKTHLKTLYEKLGVNDRAAAVAGAMRRGLLE